jgi:hypothetical protein
MTGPVKPEQSRLSKYLPPALTLCAIGASAPAAAGTLCYTMFAPAGSACYANPAPASSCASTRNPAQFIQLGPGRHSVTLTRTYVLAINGTIAATGAQLSAGPSTTGRCQIAGNGNAGVTGGHAPASPTTALRQWGRLITATTTKPKTAPSSVAIGQGAPGLALARITVSLLASELSRVTGGLTYGDVVPNNMSPEVLDLLNDHSALIRHAVRELRLAKSGSPNGPKQNPGTTPKA